MTTLSKLRFRSFLTQKALADRLGIHPRLISAWEQGRHRPSMENLKLICETFGIGAEDVEWPPKVSS
jgi:transcriptional regulator with XRE-family HTH domain